MPLLSWFTTTPTSSSTKQKDPKKPDRSTTQHDESLLPSTPVHTIDFDEIATHFADLTAEVARLQQHTEAQQVQIRGYLAQIQEVQSQRQHEVKNYEGKMKDLRTSLANEKSSLAALQSSILSEGGPRKLKELRREGPVAPFLRILQTEREKRKRDIAATENQCAPLTKEKLALKKELDDTRIKNAELKLDIEFLKCTAVPLEAPVCKLRPEVTTLGLEAPLPEVPFVLVLIDADAYVFAEMLPNPYADSSMHPGARMAHSIKNYLLTYIASHGLPSHCKLLVRALVNGTGFKPGKAMGHMKRNEQVVAAIEDFMIRFTEYAPLFEFYDAGQGKERVDGKIHEMYKTFITNSSCHKIFLGVARDNGFARMLEPYIYHSASRAKTCLISAGDVAIELQRLNIETVEWPAVFARQSRPKQVLLKEAKRDNRRCTEEAKAIQQQDALIRKLGKAGYEDFLKRQTFLQLTKELVGLKSAEMIVQELRNLRRQVVGVRTDFPRLKNLSLEAEIEDTEIHGHEELCIEVGVD